MRGDAGNDLLDVTGRGDASPLVLVGGSGDDLFRTRQVNDIVDQVSESAAGADVASSICRSRGCMVRKGGKRIAG